MTEYVSEVLGSAPEELLRGQGQACTPASNDLFKISDTEQQLPKHRFDTFHTLTAQLLFLCKRGRPDIQVAVAFLCTRVHEARAHRGGLEKTRPGHEVHNENEGYVSNLRGERLYAVPMVGRLVI